MRAKTSHRIVVISMLVAGATLCQADVVFSQSDWSSTAGLSGTTFGGPVSSGFSAKSSGGNPGSFIQLNTNPPDGAYSTWLVVTDSSWTYNPLTSGSITGIDISADVDYLAGPSSGFFQVVAEQGGNCYYAIGNSVTAGSWQNSSATGLTPGNFAQINADGSWNYSSNPDFSSAGGTITFGYALGVNGVNDPVAGFADSVGYDNVNIDLHVPAAPEPTSYAALGVGLIAILRRRNRK